MRKGLVTYIVNMHSLINHTVLPSTKHGTVFKIKRPLIFEVDNYVGGK